MALFLLGTAAAVSLTVGAAGYEENPAADQPHPCEDGDCIRTVEAVGIPVPSNGLDDGIALIAEPNIDGAIAALRQGIWNGAQTISISQYGIPGSEMQSLLNRMLRTYPELFALDGWRYSYYSPETVVSVTPNYTITGDAYAEAKAFYTASVEEIADLVDPAWSEPEQILFVHDYLAANYEYDHSYQIYDAYGFFLNKTGVCQGYTMAFTAVMNELGIPVSYVESNYIDHIWNLVQMDGKWYHVDVTWDDPSYDRLGRASHEDFLRGDDDFNEHDDEVYGRADWNYGVSKTLMAGVGYANALWENAMSPFVNVQGTWYFLESDITGNTVTASRLMRWNGDVSSAAVTVYEGNNYGNRLVSVGSGMGYYAGKLYFNTYHGLYSYDLQTNEMEQLVSGSSGTIVGCRLEDDGSGGKILKYQKGTNGSREFYTYEIDPYTAVTDGGYGYYQSEGTVYLNVESGSTVVLAGYDGSGRMQLLRVYDEESTAQVTPGDTVEEIRILSAGGWVPRCEVLELSA